MTRIAALDGLRAVLALAVFAFHASRGAMSGHLAVPVFFALSGALLERVAKNDRGWTMRRIGALTRIPALGMVVGFVLLLTTYSPFDAMMRTLAAPFVLALWPAPENGELIAPFVHYWSLAIEVLWVLSLPVSLPIARQKPWGLSR